MRAARPEGQQLGVRFLDFRQAHQVTVIERRALAAFSRSAHLGDGKEARQTADEGHDQEATMSRVEILKSESCIQGSRRLGGQ